MTLSRRAQAYLATLHREEPLPVAAVEKLLVAQNVPAHPAWLSFHEQFAGYHEDLGSDDVAVYGLAWMAGGTLIGALYGHSVGSVETFVIVTQVVALVAFIPVALRG